MLLMMVILVPLPPAILDILISLNISLAIIILLTTLYMKKALEFSVFPSLLLATTGICVGCELHILGQRLRTRAAGRAA